MNISIKLAQDIDIILEHSGVMKICYSAIKHDIYKYEKLKNLHKNAYIYAL